MGKFDNVKKQFADFNLKKVEDAFLVSLDYDTKARAIAMCVLAWKNGIASALISTSTGGIDNVVVDVIFSAALVEKRTNTKISDELIEKSIIAALKDIKIDDIDITKTNDGVAVLNLNKNEIINFTKSFYHHLFSEIGDSNYSKIVSSKEFFENYEPK